MPDKPTFKLLPAPGTPGAPTSELTAQDRNDIEAVNESIKTYKKVEQLKDWIRDSKREAGDPRILCELFGLPANWAYRGDENYARFREHCEEEARVLNFPPGPFLLSQLLTACQRHPAQGNKPIMADSATKGTDVAPIQKATPVTGVDGLTRETSTQRGVRRRSVIDPLLSEKGWTVYRWEKVARVSSKVAQRYMDGKTGKLSVDSRNKLAGALGVPASGLPD